jgi:drug/metabolite transporter (DMT)-like permease
MRRRTYDAGTSHPSGLAVASVRAADPRRRTTAVLSSLGILAAGLAALAVLRERTGGRRLAMALVALAVCLILQHGLGTAAADGDDTLWLHIPFGVAIFAFAAQADMLARRLESGASG